MVPRFDGRSAEAGSRIRPKTLSADANGPPLFYPRPLDVSPTLQCVGVLLSCSTLRFLQCWGQLPEDLQHMMGMVVDVESLANDLSDAFPGPQIGRKSGTRAPLRRMRVSVFNRALGNLGGRPVGDLVRRPSRPWHWTIAFHRPTDEVATFKAQATSMLLLPARRSRPAATRRASCSALVPSVRPMHTHTNRPVNQFTTSATVNRSRSTFSRRFQVDRT